MLALLQSTLLHQTKFYCSTGSDCATGAPNWGLVSFQWPWWSALTDPPMSGDTHRGCRFRGEFLLSVSEVVLWFYLILALHFFLVRADEETLSTIKESRPMTESSPNSLLSAVLAGPWSLRWIGSWLAAQTTSCTGRPASGSWETHSSRWWTVSPFLSLYSCHR